MPAIAVARTPLDGVVLDVSTDMTIPVQINGQILNLRVDPGLNAVLLNPESAARLRLKRSRAQPEAVVGPVRLAGNSAAAGLRIGAWTGKRSLMWFSRAAVQRADGIIGIAQLPYDVVTLRLGAMRPQEQQLTFPISDNGRNGLVHKQVIGGKEVAFLFSPWRRRTQATASAGAHLAQQLGGSWSGAQTFEPMLLGVMRPVRRMSFRQALSLQVLRIDQLFVRTSDYAGNYRLPPDAFQDPDEIVVIAKSRSPAKLAVIVGADLLARCSSLTFRKRAKQLSLRCLPQAVG